MNLIVAYCKNRGIGMLNEIPWRLSADITRFKKLTVGKGKNAVIMGKNTWISIPSKYKPLPKRQNLVLTSAAAATPTDPMVFASLEGAREYCNSQSFDDVWIIGGERVYKESLQKCMVDWIYATEIDAEYECDRFFQRIPSSFSLYSTTSWQVENGVRYRYRVYSLSKLD